MMTNQLTNANRIDAACFTDGDDDQFIIEFFQLSGSIVRTQYNRRITSTAYSFVPVNTWEYDELAKLYKAS